MTVETNRARRKQAERTALSDRKLTEAAIRLLVQRGVPGTTLRAVGELAGYSRGLATYRFGSKGGLFANVLQVASADWLKRLQKAVGSRIAHLGRGSSSAGARRHRSLRSPRYLGREGERARGRIRVVADPLVLRLA